jgi:hypothetical protein
MWNKYSRYYCLCNDSSENQDWSIEFILHCITRHPSYWFCFYWQRHLTTSIWKVNLSFFSASKIELIETCLYKFNIVCSMIENWWFLLLVNDPSRDYICIVHVNQRSMRYISRIVQQTMNLSSQLCACMCSILHSTIDLDGRRHLYWALPVDTLSTVDLSAINHWISCFVQCQSISLLVNCRQAVGCRSFRMIYSLSVCMNLKVNRSLQAMCTSKQVSIVVRADQRMNRWVFHWYNIENWYPFSSYLFNKVSLCMCVCVCVCVHWRRNLSVSIDNYSSMCTEKWNEQPDNGSHLSTMSSPIT